MEKVVLISGASSGIGEAIATYLNEKGYIVYGTSRNITQEGKRFKTMVMDVCSQDNVNSAIEEILKEQGRIDAVINCAGTGIVAGGETLAIADVERLFNLNVYGALRVCQTVLPSMRKNGKGIIINISSIASEMGLPFVGAYSASKAALDRFTEAMRMEVMRFGIQICLVQPGDIKTNIAQKRISSTIPANSPYISNLKKVNEKADAGVNAGLPPEVFGPYMEKIINSSKTKLIYRIGKPLEKVSILLKSILPSSLFEKILMNHYGI